MAFKIIPRLETFPAIVAFSQTIPGKLLLIACFTALVWLHGKPYGPELAAALALISLFPGYRRPLVALATFVWLWRFPPFEKDLEWLFASHHASQWFHWRFLYVAIFFLGAWLLVLMARRHPDHRVFRRPLTHLLVAYVGLIGFTSLTPLSPFAAISLWAFLIISGKYLWFLGYSLANRGSARHSLVEIFQFQPFWGSSN